MSGLKYLVECCLAVLEFWFSPPYTSGSLKAVIGHIILIGIVSIIIFGIRNFAWYFMLLILLAYILLICIIAVLIGFIKTRKKP